MRAALLVMLFALPFVAALEISSDTQVVLGEQDQDTRQLLTSAGVTPIQFVTPSSVTPGVQLLAIGGPCANPIWEQYSSITCESWPFREGEGVILSLENGSVTLLAGSTGEDTRRLVSGFILDVDVAAPQNGTAGATADGDEFTVISGEDRIITVNGQLVSVENVFIEEDVVEQITVNGELLSNLEVGMSDLTSEGLFVRVLEVQGGLATLSITDLGAGTTADGEEITIQEGDDELVTVGGEDVEIENLQVTDNEIDEVTIDGTLFTNLNDGDQRTIGSIEFEVTDVNEDEATFRFEASGIADDEGLQEGDDFTLSDGSDRTIEIEGDSIEFSDVTIIDGELSLRVEGGLHDDLIEGDLITVNGVTVRVDQINDDEATLVVE